MALRSIMKTVPGVIEGSSGGSVHLYRSILRELPRFMAIYDINIPESDVCFSASLFFFPFLLSIPAG